MIQGPPVEIHVVQPQMPHLEARITAHIILTQLFKDHESGVLFHVRTSRLTTQCPALNVAGALHDPGQLQALNQTIGYNQGAATYALQFGQFPIGNTQPFPTRHGYGFRLTVSRQDLPIGLGWIPPFLPPVPGTEGLDSSKPSSCP